MSPTYQGAPKLEPSPQLPPPSQKKSMNFVLLRGEEFHQMKKLTATEAKSPAEYTLHIIFTQFVRHAERKLNLCLEGPLLNEPPIIELLAEGVDLQFDEIIFSLGYIAKKKPKQVIDSVMFWRKSKSEVALLASTELEKVLIQNRSSSVAKTPQTNTGDLGATVRLQLSPKDLPVRGKRSISLMRSKSISKLAHRRNVSTSNISSTDPENISTKITEEFSQNKLNGADPYDKNYDDKISHARSTAIQAEKKSLASIYILCRVLIEVVKQTSGDALGTEFGGKLEEIVYYQLKTTDPVATSESFVRLANWNLFSELLGHMSEKRFLSVSDRFIADLERVPVNIAHEDEPKLHLLIHGMRYLRLTNYPLEKFEEGAEFLQSLTKFFCKSQNPTIVFAYAEVLSSLIIPLASELTAEANHPLWVESINKMYKKAQKLCSVSSTAAGATMKSTNNTVKGSTFNDGDSALILMTSALSVSSQDLFSSSWFDLIEANVYRLKPKVGTSMKTRFIICIARLLWVYINRVPDTLNNTVKKLDRLFDLLFFGLNVTGKKQQWITHDLELINAITEVIRIVAFLHLNYVLDNVILKLLRSSFNGVNLEGASPEKLVIVIKSYTLCLKDFKSGEKPKFPSDEVLNDQLNEVVALSSNKPLKTLFEATYTKSFQKWSNTMFEQKTIKNHAAYEEISRSLSLLLKLIDNQYGSAHGGKSETPSLALTASKSFTSLSSFPFGIDFNQGTRNVFTDLFAVLIDCYTWTSNPLPLDKGGSASLGISIQTFVETLVRNATNEMPFVASSAIMSLAKLASRKSAGNILTVYARIAFRMTEKPGLTYDPDYFNSPKFIKLLRIYVELLKCWLRQVSGTKDISEGFDQKSEELDANGALDDLYQVNHKAPDLTTIEHSTTKLKPYEELEWKNIITVIEEVEGNGLFFLCSDDSTKRLLAISVLKLVEQFDQSIYNSTDNKEVSPIASGESSQMGHSRKSSKYVADEGSRLIYHIENADMLDLIKPIKKELSLPERTRLSKVKNKRGILLKFASSDHGIDSTIWFRVYPRLLDILFEKCPMPVALCRSIVCVRLVQMYEHVVAFSESVKNYTSSLFNRSSTSSPPEVLVNQWKLYLIFACASLTSTNEQKMSIPRQPSHGRKKSLPMYIQHQKITSAKSVFRMVLPLLNSPQTMITEAVVLGLSCININTFKTFTENLPASINDWKTNAKFRDQEDKVRIEVIHILSLLTNRFKASSGLFSDDSTIANLVSIIKNVKSFLSVPSIQILPEFQKLRFHFSIFLENFLIGLQSKSDLSRWFPFEARIGCFNFLHEWCGFGDSRLVLDERYQIMFARASELKDSATTVAILELEKKTFQIASLSCMATICSGALKQSFAVPGKTAVISFDIKGIMTWIHEIIGSGIAKVQEIGKTALKNILSSNINTDEIYCEALIQCYSSENSLSVKEVYFTLVVEAFIKHRKVDSMPYEIFIISTFLVGTDNHEIRYAAIKCIKFVEEKFLESTEIDRFTESVCCSTMVVYKKVLFEISMKLASCHLEDAFTYISYLTKYFNVVDNSTRRDILACLLPWVQTVELTYSTSAKTPSLSNLSRFEDLRSSSGDIDAPSKMVLDNLFEITVKFSKTITNEVEALWVALGTKPQNFDLIFDYIVRNCLERRNPSFVSHSRQIIAYLVFSKPDSTLVIDKLISNLQPKAMVPLQVNFTGREEESDFPYSANLTHTLGLNFKESAFSLGQLSMVFLVDLFRSKNHKILDHLPLLLHISFSLMDHYFPLVQEQAVSLLMHTMHSIAPNHPKAKQFLETLRKRDYLTSLWTYDDLNNDKKGGITPKNMDLMVRVTLELFTPTLPSLQKDWSRISLQWATSCAVRHIACRSFQVFRSLLTFLDQPMLKDMLNRLSNTVSDESPDIQGFAMQILMTLNAITAELDSKELIDFPQLFWSSVACLSTVHEHEFIETISMMSKFVSKIDLDAPDTISCLISTFPPKWEGKFEGLQEVVLVGLRSATAWEPTIKFLDKLNKLRDSDIIGSGDRRLFTTLIVNLPRFLHAMDQSALSPEVEATCTFISEMASNGNKLGLSRIMNSLARNKFRAKKEFLMQTISAVRASFFPEYEAQTLIILLSFLSNKTPWVKLETLAILKLIFPIIDLNRDEFAGLGADLVAPLLRLLLTEYAEPALEVMDEVATISGSQLDKDILRMSMGSTSMKKEYEQTVSLFGIPNDSGWAVPMPARTSARTRHNVHAVFATCIEASAIPDEKQKDFFADEDIQFLMEDYYAPPEDHIDSASVTGEEPAASLSNMWAALDDFDSFFTKPSEQQAHMLNMGRSKNMHGHTFSLDTRQSGSSDMISPIDSVPQVYDKRALGILKVSLARTQSNTSFKSSLADNFGSPIEPNQPEVAATRKSYIPFRNSRLGKTKNDHYATPTMNGSSVFETGALSTPSRASLRSPPLSNAQMRMPSPQEVRISPEPSEAAIRFDHILGGGRKRKTKY
ncbi:transcriptional activator leucine zipper [Metschnikowia bicuspidata var. bicuspidata NRRL YB-4993]|uniref:Transcriptional activator leucine zipper n=1 Tax=Metschnikowia bicuspidata var. bicuspidata NRRL YB-4993 TaxID=869754 RepID=A0A1A0H772_9ASCO|nr:transcriptional activator leucine zipper [Metschnikowia bicuspidata var. bicuspidata NRRL YB-4993]OBA19876.1 transcriptional activator leucine zipper [Metschnikowia bicuspidata var. bicuspidata NRRL YB-4993]